MHTFSYRVGALKNSTMKLSVRGSLFCLLLLCSATQVVRAQKVEQALQSLENFPQEKVHMLFSKSNYVAGETAWFSAWVLEGYSRSNISTSLFVELYDSGKKPVDKKIIPLFNGEGNGSFTLADSLPEGAYFVRAYTTWMLNFSEDFQYIHPIAIYNPKSPQKLVADTTSPWTATAHPESGAFLDGVTTKVAVRLQSKGLAPAVWNGYVVDVAKPAEKLSPFRGFDRNVGLTTITPQKGKKYQLIVEDNQGKKQTIDLPAVAEKGVSLQVNSTTESIDYTLKFVNMPDDVIGHKVIGTINNTLVYKAGINKASPEVSSAIPADKLINGVLRLSVFDKQENLVAERLCFIQPELLNVGRPSFPPLYLSKSARGLNAFDIAPDTNYLNYTILVRDGSVADDLEDDNLLSTLWLTGDLTGKIHAPARYLSIVGDIAALDALLMSETWKRFSWKDILQGKFPEIRYIPQPYISYKGKVTTAGGRTAANATVNLIFYFADSTNQINQVETDANGEFVLNNLVFDEPFKVYYQLNTEKGSGARQTNVIFEPLYMFVPYSGALPPSGYRMEKRPPNDKLPDDIARALTNLDNQRFNEERIKTLEAVEIIASGKSNKEKLNEQLSSGMFRTMNEDVFDFVNEHPEAVSFPNILQWLQGRVAGLQMQMQNGVYIPMIRGQRAGLFLNEMPTDPNQIASIPVADIAMVKVMKSGFMGGIGGGGSGSAVAIYTKRGDTQRAGTGNQPPALNSASLNGYDKVAGFYAPDYKEAAYKALEKDTRDVIYWGPMTEATPNRPVTVKFYNNDQAQSFRVIIIGFDKDTDAPLFYNDVFK